MALVSIKVNEQKRCLRSGFWDLGTTKLNPRFSELLLLILGKPRDSFSLLQRINSCSRILEREEESDGIALRPTNHPRDPK
jgi:hypothetical protein